MLRKFKCQIFRLERETEDNKLDENKFVVNNEI